MAKRKQGFDYAAHAAKQAEAWRVRARAGQNIAPIPEVAPEDLAEREACEFDFARFCKHFYPAAFPLPFSPDHLRVVQKVEDAVLRGQLAAVAMPRGFGKSTISKAAAVWALVFGHRRWVCLIAATSSLATKMLRDGIKPMLIHSEPLARSFPEVVKPFATLGGSSLKAPGQHYDSAPTFVVWEKEQIVFPRIATPLCKSPESRVTTFGITSALRGQAATLSTGEVVRPDFVIIDDAQTKKSAASPAQTQQRYDTIMGDVLGLAGGDKSIAGIVPCTVINPDDLAERLLDRGRTPEMRGEKTKLIYSFPSNEKLWEQYFRLRENDLVAGGSGQCATDFYKANRAAMDLGAVVAWPERYPKEFESAIEHSMFLRHREPYSFAAEFQNEPVIRDKHDHQFLSAQQIAAKINGFDRGVSPQAATTVTGFIDVQQDVLFWQVVAWGSDFSGFVLDYGCFPQQGSAYFSIRNLRHKLSHQYPTAGIEGAIFSGLKDLTGDLLSRQWRRDDGANLPLSRLLIDSGFQSETIYAFARQCGHPAVMPSKGRGITASAIPFTEFRPKPGERLGDNWLIAPIPSNRSVRLVHYDANAWKTFVQLRLVTSQGDAGCLSLFKGSHFDHRLLGEHIAAEAPVRTEGRGRQLYEWKLPAHKPDNHWLDCIVGAAVGASIEGVSLRERVVPKQRARIPLNQMGRG